MTDKPPYHARNQRERQWMIDWTIDQVHDVSEREFIEHQSRDRTEEKLDKYFNDVAIAEADYGDIEPLRQRYPQLARFLFAPIKRKKRPKGDKVAMAVAVLPYIREIWKREYGRWKRPRGEVSAIEVAAVLWGVDPADIEKRLKPSGPSGKKKKLKPSGP
jgi:hypothetical protein